MSNSINQYWPIYRRIERSVDQITHSIHVCDNQMDVYSSEIADLIIRIGAEVEAISKAIYRRDVDAQMPDDTKFDDVAIKYFINRWKLDQKVAILSHPNCFCSDRLFFPFIKDTERTGKKRKTFSWNNAYQNLRHNREAAFHFANIRFLLSGMAALYILNIYYRDETIELEEDQNAAKVNPGLGAEFFSVQFSVASHWDGNHVRHPKEDFSNCVYFVDKEPEYAQKLNEAMDKFYQAYNNEIMNSNEAQDAIKNLTPEMAASPNWLRNAISSQTYKTCAQKANSIAPIPKLTPKYQARINRHQVLDTPTSS